MIFLPPPSAAAAARRLDARQHDLVDVQEAVLVQADVDERGLQPGQDVVDLALVDVADDRAVAAALEVELGDAVAGAPGRAVLRVRPPRGLRRRACPSPRAARRGSLPRSTLTSTCFFTWNAFLSEAEDAALHAQRRAPCA